MVYTCFLCKWRGNKLPRRSFHKFPTNEEMKLKWLQILGKSNVSIGKRTSLCSIHFEEDCFRYGLVHGMRILKEGSLPTLRLTSKNTKNEVIDVVDKKKCPKSDMESISHTQHSFKDDTSKLIEDDQLIPTTISSPNEIIIYYHDG